MKEHRKAGPQISTARIVTHKAGIFKINLLVAHPKADGATRQS